MNTMTITKRTKILWLNSLKDLIRYDETEIDTGSHIAPLILNKNKEVEFLSDSVPEELESFFKEFINLLYKEGVSLIMSERLSIIDMILEVIEEGETSFYSFGKGSIRICKYNDLTGSYEVEEKTPVSDSVKNLISKAIKL